jgi:uncharacterized protein (TIGR01244 family)
MADIRMITEIFSAAPQFDPAEASGLAGDGYCLVICNRPDGEDPGQPSAAAMRAAVEAAGMGFVAIPVSGAPTREQVDAMAEALAGAEGRVLAYCRSGTRSTTLWAMASASAGGDPDELITAAAGGGYNLSGHRSLLQQLQAG